jgi:hypothetical protein
LRSTNLERNIKNRAQEQQHYQDSNHNNRRPGDDIETKFVYMTPHQAAIIDQQDNKNQQDGQHSRIQILQHNQHLDNWEAWY